VLRDGGPWHSRVDVEWYLDRLRSTGRGGWAEYFEKLDPQAPGLSDQAFLDPSVPSELR